MTEKDGIAWGSSVDMPYARLQPADHTAVCWASAIGQARRAGMEHGEAAARWALEWLAGGGQCLCRRKRRG